MKNAGMVKTGRTRILFLTTAILSALLTIPIATPAQAAWTGDAAGEGLAVAQIVPAGSTPGTVVSGNSVTVSWSPTVLTGGTPVSGYIISRFSPAGVPQTVLNGCAGIITATSCVETAIPSGDYYYTITPRRGSWSGPSSPNSANIFVGTASLTFTSPTTFTALPTIMTGTLANFFAGEALTYRLDSATGLILSGTPTTATAVGGGNASITIPVGTIEGPHSIFVVGAQGRTAAQSFFYSDPPVIQTLRMNDANGNGRVDQIIATFNRTLAVYSAGTAPWTLANVPSGGTLTSVTTSGMIATLNITEGPGAPNTAVGPFTIALAANSNGIRTANGSLGFFAAQTPADGAVPVRLSLQGQDVNANGKIDRAQLVYSEPLAAYTAGITPFTVTGIPSTGTFASVTVAGANVTLNITEGLGAVNTATAGFTVAMVASATGVRDAANNQASFPTLNVTDAAPPVLTPGTLLTVDADNNGKLDRITATFSEILTSQGTGTAFTLANVPSGSTLGLVDVTGGTNAALVLNVGPGPADTAVGSFTIALSNATSGGIGDAAGNRASFPATAPLDRAEPIVTSILMRDVNVNGKVDQLDIAFSEILGPYTIKTRSPFTLTNVPSNGSPGIETFVGNMAILAVNEGNGAADTSVGNFTVDLKTNIRGVQDPAANLSFFAGRSPIDGAAAVPVSLTSTNGTIDGLVQPGDNISVTFSEGLDPATVIRNTDVTLAAPVGGGNNTLSIGGITNGALSLGTTGYVTAPGTSASFAASTVALSNLNRTITVTVAGACTGTGCGALGAPAVAGTFTYQPSPALKGVAGISAVGSVAVTTRIF